MTNIEKGVIVAIVICLVVIIGSCRVLVSEIDKAGGVSEVAIAAGKEVKHIVTEVGKD